MDAAEIQKRTRGHLIAFGAILVLALAAAGSVMAGVSSLFLIGGIACVQVLVVLFAMMHANADGFWVKTSLVSAAFLVVALVGLMILGHRSRIVGSEQIRPVPAPAAQAAETH